jgi:hypothetical protein
MRLTETRHASFGADNDKQRNRLKNSELASATAWACWPWAVKTLSRGRFVGGSRRRRQNSTTAVPGKVTPRSHLQSQILASQDAPSPSQHPTAFLSGRQDLNLRPPGPPAGYGQTAYP